LSEITIALDESTKSTGYAVFQDTKLIDYGAFIQNSKNVLERVSNIINDIEEMIEYYNPSNMVIENVQITMSAPTAKSLMGLQFLIELLCYRKNINCTTIRTAHWRKVLGLSNSPKIKKEDKKKEAINYVKDKYGINEKINDVTDAICIGECYLKERGNNK
jgi:Holliday junction resolvasome RuvABC endonuclease subunit